MSYIPVMQAAQKSQPQLLLCSQERDSVLAMQGAVFRKAGYSVTALAANKQIEEVIEKIDFDVLVLNHTLCFADRKLLAQKAKIHKPLSGVLVLHHSGALENPHVDLAVDSRTGATAMLKGLQRLEGMLHARSHHLENVADYFVVADAARNYTFVTDGVCELLGYERAMLMELRIDNIVAGATPVAAPLFEQFVADGEQAGNINLRHRSGRLVPVKYWAKVESDGCMIARWEPLQAATVS